MYISGNDETFPRRDSCVGATHSSAPRSESDECAQFALSLDFPSYKTERNCALRPQPRTNASGATRLRWYAFNP